MAGNVLKRRKDTQFHHQSDESHGDDLVDFIRDHQLLRKVEIQVYHKFVQSAQHVHRLLSLINTRHYWEFFASRDTDGWYCSHV